MVALRLGSHRISNAKLRAGSLVGCTECQVLKQTRGAISRTAPRHWHERTTVQSRATPSHAALFEPGPRDRFPSSGSRDAHLTRCVTVIRRPCELAVRRDLHDPRRAHTRCSAVRLRMDAYARATSHVSTH